MAVYVTFVNLNTEEKPSFYIKMQAGKSRPDTWYRKKIEYPFGPECSVLPAFSTIEDIRREIEAVAKAAFELGREVERAIQDGTKIGVD